MEKEKAYWFVFCVLRFGLICVCVCFVLIAHLFHENAWQQLRKAMKGFGTDEEEIIEVRSESDKAFP